MGIRESRIERDSVLTASECGSKLFRNNVGKAWIGQSTRLKNGDVLIKNARYFHAGLCEGSSDEIGWTPLIITPEMVGKKIAVFTAMEVKTKTGRATEQQNIFLNAVKNDGGYGFVCKDPNDVILNLALDPSVTC